MVITSEEEEGQRKAKIKGFNDRMEIETFYYNHFLLSGDCIKIQGDGVKVVCSKDDSWRMDRHRNMLLKICHEIDDYIRLEFRREMDSIARVGPFGMMRCQKKRNEGTQ